MAPSRRAQRRSPPSQGGEIQLDTEGSPDCYCPAIYCRADRHLLFHPVASLDRICASLGLPAGDSAQAAAAKLVELLPATAWAQWPRGTRTTATREIREDAGAVLSELASAMDAGELNAFVNSRSGPSDRHWDELLAGRAERSQQSAHGQSLHHFATATVLASIALDLLTAYATDHPTQPD